MTLFIIFVHVGEQEEELSISDETNYGSFKSFSFIGDSINSYDSRTVTVRLCTYIIVAYLWNVKSEYSTFVSYVTVCKILPVY